VQLRNSLIAATATIALVASASTAAAYAADLGDGAWSWFSDPRAITYHDRTYVS